MLKLCCTESCFRAQALLAETRSFFQTSLPEEMQAHTTKLIPCRISTSPTVKPTAATLIHGFIMHIMPAAVSRMPIASTQPQARTPSARRSKALTNLPIPENKSQSVNSRGNESSVNHWLNRSSKAIITVSTPFSSSQPEEFCLFRQTRLFPQCLPQA